MAAGTSTEDLLKRLETQHQAYLETFKLVHEALQTAGTRSNSTSHQNTISFNAQNYSPLGSSVLPSIKKLRRSTLDTDADSQRSPSFVFPTKPSTFHSSILTGDSDVSDDDEDLYVQTPLPSFAFDHEDLRKHLKTYPFNESGKLVLEGVLFNGRLLNPALFEKRGEQDDVVDSHYSVFDIAADGAPLSRHDVVTQGTTSIDDAIWQAVRDLNADPAKERKAVGRITIIREPSPVVFGALHLTMNDYFDMDELFTYLVEDSEQNTTRAHMSQTRAFSEDHRRQRSFVFSFEYFTIVGEDCQPMPWQLGERVVKDSEDQIPISRCSSIVALSLTGPPIRKLKNVSRRKKTFYGHVYDPWAAWHVLNAQCYPDLKHSMDSHDSTKHYVNGPEAFLHTLLAEFKDAQKRFQEIYRRITKLITPPADFMFNSELRDKLLFEDAQFTYSRRYFWAFQTLGIMNNCIKSMVDSYEDTFTDEVWQGKHKYLWPMVEEDSARNTYWRKRMAALRKDFEREVEELRTIADENNERRKEIRTLRDQLFSGTSVLESRKSVEMASITIQQGHNIKLLTLVSIFFLPLTFVTSVFGMTNMPTEHQFASFGIVMATVCVPFFLLIGSLNTTQGMEFWVDKYRKIISIITRKPRLETQNSTDNTNTENRKKRPRQRPRSMSQLEALAARKRRLSTASTPRMSPSSTFGQSESDAQEIRPAPPIVRNGSVIVNDEQRNKEARSLVSTSPGTADRSKRPWFGFMEKVLGRKKKGRESEHDV